MQKSKPVLKIISLIIAIVVLSLLAIFEIKKKIEIKAKQIFEKQTMLAAIENRNENYSSLKSKYEIVKENLPIMKNLLPEEENLDVPIKALENLAPETNNTQMLKFESAASSKTEGENAKKINFSTTLTGNFETFTKYLEDLYNMPYFIKINSIDVKNSTGIYSSNGQMTINATLFYRK